MCCVAPGGARAGAAWGLWVRLGQSREGGRGQGPAIPDSQSPRPRPLTCPATLDSPPEPRVNIGTGLLSWFNMCYVPTVFWSLTQTPAGLREPMEVRGQLLHRIPVENVSPCVDLDSCVYMSACACVLGVILDYCIYQMHKLRPRDVTPLVSRPSSFPPLIHPDTTCWRRMNWGHFQEPGRDWDRSPPKCISSHAGPANHQL